MAELDERVGLVGRANIVSLVELLLERGACGPLPVTVVYGPGGSGKTAVITHLERCFDANTPLAKVELTRDNSRTPRDVLDAVLFRLCRDSHEQFGKLRLLRYEIARVIRACASAADGKSGEHLILRQWLAEQLTVSTLAEGVRQGGEVGGGAPGFLARALRPLTRWMFGAAVVAPRPLRWLLAGPKFSRAFRWYEQEVPEILRGVSSGAPVDKIGARVHGLINDQPVSDTTRNRLSRLMAIALLADRTPSLHDVLWRVCSNRPNYLVVDGTVWPPTASSPTTACTSPANIATTDSSTYRSHVAGLLRAARR